jgi:hypothetical protein
VQCLFYPLHSTIQLAAYHSAQIVPTAIIWEARITVFFKTGHLTVAPRLVVQPYLGHHHGTSF